MALRGHSMMAASFHLGFVISHRFTKWDLGHPESHLRYQPIHRVVTLSSETLLYGAQLISTTNPPNLTSEPSIMGESTSLLSFLLPFFCLTPFPNPTSQPSRRPARTLATSTQNAPPKTHHIRLRWHPLRHARLNSPLHLPHIRPHLPS